MDIIYRYSPLPINLVSAFMVGVVVALVVAGLVLWILVQVFKK